MRKIVVAFAILLLSTGAARAQNVPEVFGNQIIVSPKGLDAIPFVASTSAVPTSASAKATAPATAPVTLTESDLREISQAAGIYVAANPGVSCPPGQVCKSQASTGEQINLRDVGASGDLSRVIEVTSTDTGALDRTIGAINASATLEATANYWRRTTQQQEPQFALQWGFAGRDVALGGANFISAWNRTRGSANTVVAVVDTGVVRTHPEVGPALVGGIDLITVLIRSGDGDGADLDATDSGDFIDLILQSFFSGFGIFCDAKNSSWHGTHVAGTIAGRVNGQFGTGGAPNVRILPVRVLGKCGGDDRTILDGIAWAMGLEVPGVPINPNPAQVINLSLGGASPCSSNYRRLFAEARRRNIIVVVSAGNDSRNTSGYTPAGCPDVISVAAHDRNGFSAGFSNFGSNVAISAPGVSILSSVDFGTTLPVGPTTKEYQGTSMAAPHVAAAVALLKSARPSITYDEVLQFLRSSASPFLSGSGCAQFEVRSGQCGSGILDADKLLAMAGVGTAETPSGPQPTPTPSPSPTPTPTLPPPQNDAGGGSAPCFIATAAFGTPMAEEVQVLRKFRDDVLLSSAIGSAFVNWYYDVSPPIANVIRRSKTLRAITRASLTPVIEAVRNPMLAVVGVALAFIASLLLARIKIRWRGLRERPREGRFMLRQCRAHN